MPNKNKIIGTNFEREVVKALKEDHNIESKRAWGSNGEALGEDKEVDVLISDTGFKIQCKKTKKLPNWLGMSDKVDAVVFKENRGNKYVLLDFDLFFYYYRMYLDDIGVSHEKD